MGAIGREDTDPLSIAEHRDVCVVGGKQELAFGLCSPQLGHDSFRDEGIVQIVLRLVHDERIVVFQEQKVQDRRALLPCRKLVERLEQLALMRDVQFDQDAVLQIDFFEFEHRAETEASQGLNHRRLHSPVPGQGFDGGFAVTNRLDQCGHGQVIARLIDPGKLLFSKAGHLQQELLERLALRPNLQIQPQLTVEPVIEFLGRLAQLVGALVPQLRELIQHVAPLALQFLQQLVDGGHARFAGADSFDLAQQFLVSAAHVAARLAGEGGQACEHLFEGR